MNKPVCNTCNAQPTESSTITDFGNSVACTDCHLFDLCLPISISKNEIDHLDRAVDRSGPYFKGRLLFQQGEPCTAIYAIKSGATKLVFRKSQPNVPEQILNFCLPGELAGLEGLAEGTYPYSCIALDRTTVCKMPLKRISSLSKNLPVLNENMIGMLSQKIYQEKVIKKDLIRWDAKNRLLGFLKSLYQRLQVINSHPSEFVLPMSRKDISDYLGLTIETISRLLSSFQKENLLAIDGRKITILNLTAFDSIPTTL